MDSAAIIAALQFRSYTSAYVNGTMLLAIKAAGNIVLGDISKRSLKVGTKFQIERIAYRNTRYHLTVVLDGERRRCSCTADIMLIIAQLQNGDVVTALQSTHVAQSVITLLPSVAPLGANSDMWQDVRIDSTSLLEWSRINSNVLTIDGPKTLRMQLETRLQSNFDATVDMLLIDADTFDTIYETTATTSYNAVAFDITVQFELRLLMQCKRSTVTGYANFIDSKLTLLQ